MFLHERAAVRWLLFGGLAVVAILGLVVRFLADDPGREADGQVKLMPLPAPAPLATADAATDPAIEMPPAPVEPTVRNAQLAGAQASRMLDEKRDREWAPRSEVAILTSLKAVPALGGERVLIVKCTATACEATGVADPDPATGSMKPTWEAIERGTAGGQLRAAGLERSAVVFDTGRSGDEFKIYYRRLEMRSAR